MAAKLYFRFGTMGFSKTAQALITKFNYEEKGMKAILIKPAVDTRDGEAIVKSRIGLQAKAFVCSNNTDITRVVELIHPNVVIVDESQFLSKEQVDELRDIVDYYDIPVICYGLRTDFKTHLFPGSKRLFELADSISEIKSICSCGNKAIFNVRIDKDGKHITTGKTIELGSNERYVSCCSKCFGKTYF